MMAKPENFICNEPLDRTAAHRRAGHSPGVEWTRSPRLSAELHDLIERGDRLLQPRHELLGGDRVRLRKDGLGACSPCLVLFDLALLLRLRSLHLERLNSTGPPVRPRLQGCALGIDPGEFL